MNDRGQGFKLFFNILIIIFSVFFIFFVVKFLFTSNTLSFSGFLDYISNCPSINVNYQDLLSPSDFDLPDYMSWFGWFIDKLAWPINIFYWLSRNIANLVLFVVYFVKFLFI